MMETNQADFHNSMDHQEGMTDGISFAYAFGVKELDEQAFMAAAFKGTDAYAKGFAEGYAWIKDQFNDSN